MDSSKVRKKIEEDERKVKQQSYDDATISMTGAVNQENERFLGDQKQVTKKLIQDQDKSLEHLGHAVGRLEQYGREINTEVKEQGKLMDSLGNEIDVASEKMNTVQAALSKLLKTKDGCQIWTIVILALILIILVACVIWT
jgi:t-SNARE complex subunit (syntaxin)